MQSSRMHTARSLTMGGCLLLGGVCSQGVCSQGGLLPGGLLPGGVCSQGGLSLGGGRGVCSQGGLPGGGWGIVCSWGVPCDLSDHAFDVTCMLPPHQLRPTSSAAAYILLVGHVTCKACWDTTTPTL